MEKIYLKEWVKPMAEHHATSYVEDVLGLEKGDPKYQKEFDKEFYNFCKELYGNSLIPHAANPTIPAGKNVFQIFEPDFMSSLKGETLEMKREMYSQITRSVSMIARILVESEMGKMKYDLRNVEGSKDERTEKFHDSVRNRYKRLVFISMIMGLVKSMFKLQKGELDSFVDGLLKSTKWRSLQSTSATKDFATKIKNAVEKDVADYKPLEAIRKEFEK